MALSDGIQNPSQLRRYHESMANTEVSPSTPPNEGVGRAWLREHALDDVLELPDDAERMGAVVFDETTPRVLRLGRNLGRIDKGSFFRSVLECVEIPEDNEWFSTDGTAIFSKDGSVLVALAVPVEEYAVPAHCTHIEAKAFFRMASLKRIELPDGIVEIGPYAFSQSGLISFSAPSSLRVLNERAFFRCAALHDVTLNDGLASIGEGAFANTAIDRLHIPGTVEELGIDFAASTDVGFSGSSRGLTIGGGSNLLIDEQGGLYRMYADGLHLVRIMDKAVEHYKVRAGTRVIDERAFVRHPDLRSVHLPEGVEEIGPAAFWGCAALRSVRIPDSLRVVGKEAFYDTSIESFHIPAGLDSIGDLALVTRAAAHGGLTASLTDIRVHPDNKTFHIEGGMVIEYLPERESYQVLHFLDDEEVVEIPENVSRIAPYAFAGTTSMRELHISDRVRRVGPGAFDVSDNVELVHVDVVRRPIEGHPSFDLKFPPTNRALHEFKLAFSMSTRLDIERILKHYDDAIIYMSDFGNGVLREGAGSHAQYVQAKSIIERLQDPVLMSDRARRLFERTVRGNITDICVAVARHDDREAVDALLDLGFLDEESLLAAIEVVGELKDAAMTGYLLEVKRLRFGGSAMDFDL